METIFITGSSAGVGKATAQLFAAKGWKVIATMRNPEKETELTALTNVTLLPLDVSDLNQIKTTVEKTLAMGDVNVVFNNAAYGIAGPLEGIPDEELIRQIDTNLLGVIRTTQAFIPYFRIKKSGLFITTTSIGALVTLPFGSVYHATKWALEGWSQSMAYELKQFGIGIKTVVPGGIKTNFANKGYYGRHEAYNEMVNKAMATFIGGALNHSTAEQIADVVYEAATDGKDRLRYLAGEDAKEINKRLLQVGYEAVHNDTEQRFFG